MTNTFFVFTYFYCHCDYRENKYTLLYIQRLSLFYLQKCANFFSILFLFLIFESFSFLYIDCVSQHIELESEYIHMYVRNHEKSNKQRQNHHKQVPLGNHFYCLLVVARLEFCLFLRTFCVFNQMSLERFSLVVSRYNFVFIFLLNKQ